MGEGRGEKKVAGEEKTNDSWGTERDRDGAFLGVLQPTTVQRDGRVF